MESKIYNFPKMNQPLYYQKNKGKISHQKKSSDCKFDKNINMYNYSNYNNTGFEQPYKRTQSPLSNNLNTNLPFRLNKINESIEKINFDFKNISPMFNINTDNIIELPNLKKEKTLDFNIYCPLTNFEEENPDLNNFHIFEEELLHLCRYGIRFINNDISNCENDKNDQIIFLQSCIRSFLLRKRLHLIFLDKIYLERKNIRKIIILQRNIRCFLEKLKIRKKIIINYITQKRKNAINKIINKMRSYNNILKTKKYIFLKSKIEERSKNVKYIQETFRNYKFYYSFKKLMKEINEKYCIIYPTKGKKVELLLYLDDDEKTKTNNEINPRKYIFNFNKLLKCFILFISPAKLYAGKYKCQFIIDDIVICDKNYPYVHYKNELYNIIEFKPNKTKKMDEKQLKRKERKEKNEIKNKLIDSNKNFMKENILLKNVNASKSYKNNYYEDEEYDELEDIKEEDDEGRSTTSKEYLKKIKDSSDYDDLDFTEEDIINIKKMKGNNIINTDYKKLREDLLDKNAVSKGEKIRKNSFKAFQFNY